MEEATVQELGNNLVTFSIQKKPACLIEFHTHASKQLVTNAHSSAAKSLAKEVTLPGFRKGKAPESLILKNFPKELDKAWQEHIANAAFRECQLVAKLPMTENSKVTFSMKNHSLDGADLVLNFETTPTVPPIDAQAFTPSNVERPEVNEEKIQETIRQVKFFFASWSPIEDRPVQEGDFVLLDVDIIETTPSTPLFSKTRFEVSDKYMAKWMKDLVMGHNLHEAIEGISKPDADAKNIEDFKEQKVLVTIRQIEQCTLPEITEQFYQGLGVNSEEDLYNAIAALLNKQADQHVKEALQEQVNDFLVQNHPFDIPRSLIVNEVNFRMKHLSQDSSFRSHWDSISEEERKTTFNSIATQSEKSIRLFFLCRKILADAKIDISPKDLPEPASNFLEMLLDPTQMLNYHENAEIKQAEALSKVIMEKAAEHVLQNCHKE